ncbi:MAG: hypothetical protein ABI237_18790 [Ginsengibacter sp.]
MLLAPERNCGACGHVVKYQLFTQIADGDDTVVDPSIAWPARCMLVFLGTVEIKGVSSNTEAADKALFFSPENIPAGITTADPILYFRAKAHPISVKERQ